MLHMSCRCAWHHFCESGQRVPEYHLKVYWLWGRSKGSRVSSQGLLIVSPGKGFQSIISRSIDCEAWPKSFRVMPLFFQNLIIFHVSLFPVTKLVLWSIQITIIDSSSCLSCCLSNVHVFSLYSSFIWHMDICMWGLRCTVRVRWAVPQGRQLLPGMSQSLWCH